MGVLTDSMRAGTLVPLDLTVQVIAPVMTANTHLTGEKYAAWTNPTVTATVLGHLEPASTRALERVSRLGKTGVHELTTEAVTLTPLGRVRVGAQQYLVLDARNASTHTFAIVEEVSP